MVVGPPIRGHRNWADKLRTFRVESPEELPDAPSVENTKVSGAPPEGGAHTQVIIE